MTYLLDALMDAQTFEEDDEIDKGAAKAVAAKGEAAPET